MRKAAHEAVTTAALGRLEESAALRCCRELEQAEPLKAGPTFQVRYEPVGYGSSWSVTRAVRKTMRVYTTYVQVKNPNDGSLVMWYSALS